MKFLSRKFIVTVLIFILGPTVPMAFKQMGISDEITLSVLALVGSVGIAYKVVQGQVDKQVIK